MIYVICCGGRTGAGGMPRMVDYYMTEWETCDRLPSLVLIDSTGPNYDWRLHRPWAIWRQPLYCLSGLVRVAAAGCLGRVAALHVHMADRGSVLRKGLFIHLAGLLRCPVVIHMHAATFAEFYTGLNPFLQQRVRRLLRRAARFIVLGRSYQEYFIETVKLDPALVVVAHNAVPAPFAVSEPQNGDTCDLLFAGTLVERKGLGDLLQALAQPRVRALSWKLHIAGEGDQSQWLRLVETYDLSSRVTFLGWVSSANLRQRLEACDVLLLPSRNEGLPMVILEAMAHARPVIATPVGSVSDAVKDEETGLLVPPRDPDALALALERLITDPVLRRQLGRAARSAFDKNFTISRLNDQLEGLLSQVIAQDDASASQNHRRHAIYQPGR